jgi:pimeloyl-ACP methyl ester carboxylesterase
MASTPMILAWRSGLGRMTTTRSSDGTVIAYEQTGAGPPLILVDGALCHRAFGPSRPLAAELADRFTVYTYDRRGRGQSSDTAPYAVEREVEDLEAVIDAAGGAAHVYGISSGAVLALEAVAHGAAIESLVLYEPPFIVDHSRPPQDADYLPRLEELIAADRRGDAVRLFMRQVGMPAPLIALMRLMPPWRKLKAVAHTLRYDARVMGATQAGRPLPAHRWRDATIPTLVVTGGKSEPWMHRGNEELADLLANAEHTVLEGQNHMVKARALAPLIAEHVAQRAVQPRSIV